MLNVFAPRAKPLALRPAIGSVVYLSRPYSVRDEKTGAMLSAKKGRAVTIISVVCDPADGMVVYGAFRVLHQRFGVNTHALVCRPLDPVTLSLWGLRNCLRDREGERRG